MSKNTLRVEINQFCVGFRDTMSNSYTFEKNIGMGFPTHFLKSRGSVIRNIFLNTELNKSTCLLNKMLFKHYLPQIKQKTYSIGIFHVPVVTQFIVKS